MPENIPLLANHFMQQHRSKAGRGDLALSKGALEKLASHRWPGNIRELQHAILRAVVMSEAPVIQADDIVLEGCGDNAFQPLPGEARDWLFPPPAPGEEAPPAGASKPESFVRPPPRAPEPEALVELNARQRRAWPLIVRHGSVRRMEYQQWCGETISTRTAVYDLKDLVNKGRLARTGRGRSMRYLLSGAAAAGESE